MKRTEWTRGPSTYSAYPHTGARLAEWSYDNVPVIRWPSEDGPPLAKVRGGNPILFPFAGRTFADGREGHWQWEDTIRPMPRHGFARGGNFTVVSAEDGFTATLQPTAQDHEAYPFEYTFTVTYIFRERGFTVELTLNNLGSTPIPWSAGHHFYFALPTSHRANASLDLTADKAWHHHPSGALTPTAAPNQPTPFSAPELVDRIHTHVRSNPVRFGPLEGNRRIALRYEGDVADAEWVAVVAWAEHQESPYYCVEPWMGPPNSPSHRHGLAVVPAGRSGTFRVHAELESTTPQSGQR